MLIRIFLLSLLSLKVTYSIIPPVTKIIPMTGYLYFNDDVTFADGIFGMILCVDLGIRLRVLL